MKHATQQMLIDAKERFSCLVASKHIPCPVTGCGMYYTTTTSLRSHMMKKHPHEPRRTRTVTDTVVARKPGNLESDYWEKRDDGWMRYHIQPRLKYCQPDAGEGGPDVSTLDGRRITRLQETGQDPEDVEDEWDVDETVRMHSIPWTGMNFFPITHLDDIEIPDVSGIIPAPEDRQESAPKKRRIGPSLGETMRTRLVEKLKQARVQRAGPYAGGRARARSILEGAQEMFRTTDPTCCYDGGSSS